MLHLSGIDARIKPVTGAEVFINQRTKATSTHQIFLDGDEDVLVTDEVEIASTRYKILNISDYNTVGGYQRLDVELK